MASRFFALLALLALAVAILAPLARLSRAVPEHLAAEWDGLRLWFAAAVGVTATLGSLYYSEIVGFVPCTLCWYQRICMYPLAVILPIAAARGDEGVRRYVTPLAVVGAGISAYHYLVQ
jgi:disulfide bond formation protein DsbB